MTLLQDSQVSSTCREEHRCFIKEDAKGITASRRLATIEAADLRSLGKPRCDSWSHDSRDNNARHAKDERAISHFSIITDTTEFRWTQAGMRLSSYSTATPEWSPRINIVPSRRVPCDLFSACDPDKTSFKIVKTKEVLWPTQPASHSK